jgi:hypothetical protein
MLESLMVRPDVDDGRWMLFPMRSSLAQAGRDAQVRSFARYASPNCASSSCGVCTGSLQAISRQT